MDKASRIHSLAKPLALGAVQQNRSLLTQLSWRQCFLPFPCRVGLAGLARSVWLAPAAARRQDLAQWRRQAHPRRDGWRWQGSGATRPRQECRAARTMLALGGHVP